MITPERKREISKKYRIANREKIRASGRKYAADHREQRREYSKKYDAEHSEKSLARHRKRYLGWTPELVESTRLEQKNACAVCGDVFTKTPHADHKHGIPPKPRGLLCNQCNKGLGDFKDSPERLQNALKYLLRWEGRL